MKTNNFSFFFCFVFEMIKLIKQKNIRFFLFNQKKKKKEVGKINEIIICSNIGWSVVAFVSGKYVPQQTSQKPDEKNE
jgi:hypothetical protein